MKKSWRFLRSPGERNCLLTCKAIGLFACLFMCCVSYPKFLSLSTKAAPGANEGTPSDSGINRVPKSLRSQVPRITVLDNNIEGTLVKEFVSMAAPWAEINLVGSTSQRDGSACIPSYKDACIPTNRPGWMLEKEAQRQYMSPAQREAEWQRYTLTKDGPLAEAAHVDAVLCTLPAASCFRYMNTDVPIILYVDRRVDFGLPDSVDAFAASMADLRLLANRPRSYIVTTSEYDSNYIQYFAGILPPVLPPTFSNIPQKYMCSARRELPGSPSKVILVSGFVPASGAGMSGFNWQALLKPLIQHKGSPAAEYHYAHINDLYPNGATPQQLVQHAAIMHFPLQAADIEFELHYSLGIPLLIPSAQALTELHLVLGLLSQRSWYLRHGHLPTDASPITGLNPQNVTDPNDDVHPESVLQWLHVSPYYSAPHLLHFDSFEQAVSILDSVDFCTVSDDMLLQRERRDRRAQDVVDHIFSSLEPRN